MTISLCSKTWRRMLAKVTPAITIRLPTRKPWAHDSSVTPVGSVGLSTTKTMFRARTRSLCGEKKGASSQIRKLGKVSRVGCINCRGEPSFNSHARMQMRGLPGRAGHTSREQRQEGLATAEMAAGCRSGVRWQMQRKRGVASASYCGHPSRAGPGLGFWRWWWPR
jgi:hypothetical protein